MNLSKTNRHFLQFISTADVQQVKLILKSLTTRQLQILIEIVFNIVKGVIPISDTVKKTLSKQTSSIRLLILDGISPKLRQKRLVKIVDILPLMIKQYFQYESRTDTDTKGKVREDAI